MQAPTQDQPFDVLSDVTVVEFGDSVAGAICAYRLALLGARVYILEPTDGSWLRRNDLLFGCFGRGKRSASGDAARAAGAPPWQGVDLIIRPHPTSADAAALLAAVPAEPFGPLSLGFEEADGTQLGELEAQAAFGFSAYLGRLAEAPLRVGFDLITYSAAVLGTQAVLAALPLKQSHGLGQRLRIPFSRVAASLLNNVTTASVEPDQDTSFSRGWAGPPHLGIPTQDGDVEILFHGPGSDDGWRTFCRRIGAGSLADDGRFATYGGRSQNAGALRASLAPFTATWQREALLNTLRECGAMAVPRWGVAAAAESDQARANDLMLPRSSAGSAARLAAPWEIDERRSRLGRLPGLHADTAAFLQLGAVR
ncbi:MAG: CoA transferase [Lautropia sp.]